MTAEQAATLRFLESLRTFITLGRLVHLNELSEAQDNTLDNVEQILASLETELEDDTNATSDPAING